MLAISKSVTTAMGRRKPAIVMGSGSLLNARPVRDANQVCCRGPVGVIEQRVCKNAAVKYLIPLEKALSTLRP